jgi:transposase-like protein
MGGESEAAWQAVLDDLLARSLAKPALVIVDAVKNLEAALASLWQDIPAQLLHCAQGTQPARPRPKASARRGQGRLQRHNACQHFWLGPGPTQGVPRQVEDPLPAGRDQPPRGWRACLRSCAAGPTQWRSLRITNAIERCTKSSKRRIKTQCLLPCAETAMLFWALPASSQITMRRVGGWHTLDRSPTDLDLAV